MFKTFSQALKQNITFQNQIETFYNVLSDDFVQKSLNLVAKSPTERASIKGANKQSEVNVFVRDAFALVCRSEEENLIREVLKDQITKCLHTYLLAKDLLFRVDFDSLLPDTDFSYVLYEPASRGYTEHLDGHTYNSTLCRRIFSCIYYLNDDFIGGELYFPNLNYKIEVKKNSCVIFPSLYPYIHTGLPLIEGRKVICPAWFGYEVPEQINRGYII